MLRYENLGVVGEGSYGMVLKCRHKESRQIVAIKKFIESEDDEMVKKIAMREIRMLKMLRHENLVNLLEVFRRKKRVYLVFEFVDKTVLDDLERQPEGLNVIDVKRISFQVLRGLEFCHSHNVMHRDVKPENILVSNSGIVKLCDFGFARTLVAGPGEVFTDYVATRWYRSPELLVGDLSYGKAVDIWAIGCLLFEMFTGEPLFPGDSDIDQLFHVTKRLGNLTPRHQEIFQRNPLFIGLRLPNVKQPDPFWGKFPQLTSSVIDLIKKALSLEASKRPSCLEMMKHEFFQDDNFATDFLESLKTLIERATVSNPLLKSLASQKESQIRQNSDKDKSKSKKKKDCSRDVIKKNVSEIKRKKDVKYIPKQLSQPMLHSSSSSNINDGKPDNFLSKKSTTDIKKLEKMKKFSVNDIRNNVDSEVSCKENSSYHFKDVSSSCELEPLNKRSGSDRSETKLTLRTPLEVSVNMLGKNLPELNCSISGPARSHGFDTKKVKNFYSSNNSSSLNNNSSSKKSMSLHNSSTLCLLSEKVNLHHADNTTRQEGDTSKRPSLTLPSVVGAEVRSPPGVSSRETSYEPHVTTIPHIQNIDPFSNTSLSTRESTVNGPTECFERTLKSGNLPAV